jgi:hypothetical protein
VLIAPSVVFFALTGAAQLFHLHEAHGTYHPAPLIEKLGAVHKDQMFELAHEHDPAPAEATPGHELPAAEQDKPERPVTLALKWFFLLVALGLATSTCLGVWMALTQTRSRGLAWVLLAAGCLIPLTLLVMS